MVNTKRTRVSRAACVAVGLVLGGSIGAGFAFASDEYYWAKQYQQELQTEQRQTEQRNAETLRHFQESAKETIRAAEEAQRAYTPGSHSFSYTSPDHNGGRPVACTTNGQSTYCP